MYGKQVHKEMYQKGIEQCCMKKLSKERDGLAAFSGAAAL